MVSETWKTSLDDSNYTYKKGTRYLGLNELESCFYVSFDSEISSDLEIARDNLAFKHDRKCLDRYLRNVNQSIPVSLAIKLSETMDSELKVNRLKSGKNGSSIVVNGLPIDLDSKDWGFVFGMLPDANIKKYRITLKSEKLAKATYKHLRNTGANPTFRETQEGFRIHGGSVIGRISVRSGFATFSRQVQHNVIFPDWVYDTNEKFQKALIAGLIEAEGSAPTKSTRSCRITQSTSLYRLDIDKANLKLEKTPSGNKVGRVFFSNLSEKKRTCVLSNPPPLLISAKRLLEVNGISSNLVPEAVTVTSKNTSALWNLVITGEDIRHLYRFCEAYLVSKQEIFKEYFNQKKESHRDKGTRFSSYMDDIRFLYEQNGFVTSKMLSEHANRAEKTAVNTLSLLKNKEMVVFDGYEGRYKRWKPKDV